MKNRRISRTTTISLPPKLYSEVIRLAHDNGMTRSELCRDALRRYQRQETRWQEIQDFGRRSAVKAGVRSEEDIERLIDEGRR